MTEMALDLFVGLVEAGVQPVVEALPDGPLRAGEGGRGVLRDDGRRLACPGHEIFLRYDFADESDFEGLLSGDAALFAE